MTFSDWLFYCPDIPTFDNPTINGRWGLWHILTLVISILLIITLILVVKKVKNKEKAKRIIILTLASILIFFEVMIRFIKYNVYYDQLTFKWVIKFLLPYLWCSIACWALIFSAFINKKFLYNYSSTSALLCSAMFFVSPGVGYHNQYITFWNLYSIVTHAILFVMSILIINFKLADFRYKNIWKEAICYVATFIYSIFNACVFYMERDPMYFMPGGDIQVGILGISYGIYLVLYIVFLLVYLKAFYLICDRQNVKKLFRKKVKTTKS